MKIAVALAGNNHDDAIVSMRFGRAECFLINDTETGQSWIVSSDGPGMSSGAGVSTGQKLAGLGVNAVIAGNFGPSGAAVLRAAGTRMYLAGPIKAVDAVAEFAAGRLTEANEATTAAHSGLRRF